MASVKHFASRRPPAAAAAPRQGEAAARARGGCGFGGECEIMAIATGRTSAAGIRSPTPPLHASPRPALPICLRICRSAVGGRILRVAIAGRVD